VPISRRRFVSVSSLSVAAAWSRPLFGQPAPTAPAPVPKFEEIRRGVGVFTAMGGTIGYLITKDGALAVDSQYPQTAPACVAGLKEKAPAGLEVLINTHHHGDHTGGNPVFKPLVKRIVAHVNCVEWHRKVAAQAGNADQQAFADTTFTDAWQVDFGGETVHARHFGRGHTSGDALIFFASTSRTTSRRPSITCAAASRPASRRRRSRKPRRSPASTMLAKSIRGCRSRVCSRQSTTSWGPGRR